MSKHLTASSKQTVIIQNWLSNDFSSLEERITEIDELMASPEICTDVSKCMELQKEKEEHSEKLEILYEKWEELA